jgi:hypothetical protein
MSITKIHPKKLVLILTCGTLLLLFLAAWRPLPAGADNVVAGYTSKQPLQAGLVVAVDKSQPNSVKAVPAGSPNLIYGVVVDPSDAPITLVGQNSKVFVATTGTYPVLVSVANGKIKSGDYISMSGIDGIAAKAIPSQPLILGRAASDFSGASNVITTNNGKAIGRIFVSIGVQKNPVSVTDPTLPTFLRRIADGLANRTVPVIRVYTALLIFLISVLASLTILWSGVRSSLISLGRNPLSRKAIFSGMYKTIFTGLGVFIIGLAGVYLLVKI